MIPLVCALQHDILFQACVIHAATVFSEEETRSYLVRDPICGHSDFFFLFFLFFVLGNTRRARFGFNTRVPPSSRETSETPQSGSVWHAYSCVSRNDSSLSWLAVTMALAAIILKSKEAYDYKINKYKFSNVNIVLT